MRLDRLEHQKDHFLAHIFLHGSMLHGAVPDHVFKYSSTAFLSPGWSLSLEWQFYLLAPLIVTVLRGGSSLKFVLFSAVFLGCYKAGARGLFGQWGFPSFLPLAMNCFMVGILSRMFLEFIRPARVPFEFVVVAALAYQMLPGLTALIWIASYGVILVEIGSVQIASPQVNAIVATVANNEFSRTIGKWSYSTYLLHIPVFSLIVGGYAKFVGEVNVTRLEVAGLLALSLPVILVLSGISYRYVEEVGVGLGKRIAGAT